MKKEDLKKIGISDSKVEERRLELLCFDPRNPRLKGSLKWSGSLLESKSKKTQDELFEKLKQVSYFDKCVERIRLEENYLNFEPLIITKDNIIVDGNTRVAALKHLSGLNELGSFDKITVIVVPENMENKVRAYKHIETGAPWPVIRKAEWFSYLYKTMSVHEISSWIGDSETNVKTLIRAYNMFLQAINDSVIGDIINKNYSENEIEEKLFTYLRECFTISEVRNKLKWDDVKLKFKDEEGFRKFLKPFLRTDGNQRITNSNDGKRLLKPFCFHEYESIANQFFDNELMTPTEAIKAIEDIKQSQREDYPRDSLNIGFIDILTIKLKKALEENLPLHMAFSEDDVENIKIICNRIDKINTIKNDIRKTIEKLNA